MDEIIHEEDRPPEIRRNMNKKLDCTGSTWPFSQGPISIYLSAESDSSLRSNLGLIMCKCLSPTTGYHLNL